MVPSMRFSNLAASGILLALLPAFVAATTPCLQGTYSQNGNGQPPCLPCTPGTYSSIMQNSCTPCPAGTTSAAGAASCFACPAGTYATPGSDDCTLCPAGTYGSIASAGACTPCPAGAACPFAGQTRFSTCNEGTYAPVPGSTRCTACPAGTFNPYSGATRCCSCCAGFYQDNAAATLCKACPISGSYSPPGASSASQCLPGVSGGLTTCPASIDLSCPAVGGATVSQVPPVRRRGPERRGCPAGQRSCPVYGSTLRRRGYLKGYECVDVQNDLESCGGCVAHDSPFGERTAGGGRDCSAIPNAEGVQCRAGVCVIARCAAGYVLTQDGENCVDPLAIQA